MSVTRLTARPSRRGYVLVTMVLSLTILLAFLGLSIDVGYEEYIKTRMQTAADAAALGGAQELRTGGSSNLAASAKADAAANGFTDGANGVAISVNNPPRTGYSKTDGTAVEVLISQSVPTFFMAVLGVNSGMVKARAVARVGGGTSCFFTLNPSMSSALDVYGGVNPTFSCGVMVNSSSSTAFTVTGGSHVTAPYLGVVGGYSVNGGSSVSPTPSTGLSPIANPFATLAKPTVGACDYPTNPNIGGGITTTLNPGVYCAGLSISNGATVTMKPGTYIFRGGGFWIGGGAHVSGTGVTFYNTYASGSPYKAIVFDNGTYETFSAPTTGTYAGVLMFQDPAVVSALLNTIAGGTSAILTGALYFPTTGVDFSGGANASYTIIVADHVIIHGGVKVNNDYSSLPGGSPVKGNAALSE